jgi:hypothetical protein
MNTVHALLRKMFCFPTITGDNCIVFEKFTASIGDLIEFSDVILSIMWQYT